MNCEKLVNQSLCMALDLDNYRTPFVGIQAYGSDINSVDMAHLYLVTVCRKIEGEHPVISHFYCIAQDEQQAIEQVDSNAFPELPDSYEECKTLECTAVRIPFQIRGWGRQVF